MFEGTKVRALKYALQCARATRLHRV